jgi:hypothetical protein
MWKIIKNKKKEKENGGIAVTEEKNLVVSCKLQLLGNRNVVTDRLI